MFVLTDITKSSSDVNVDREKVNRAVEWRVKCPDGGTFRLFFSHDVKRNVGSLSGDTNFGYKKAGKNSLTNSQHSTELHSKVHSTF